MRLSFAPSRTCRNVLLDEGHCSCHKFFPMLLPHLRHALFTSSFASRVSLLFLHNHQSSTLSRTSLLSARKISKSWFPACKHHLEHTSLVFAITMSSSTALLPKDAKKGDHVGTSFPTSPSMLIVYSPSSFASAIHHG